MRIANQLIDDDVIVNDLNLNKKLNFCIRLIRNEKKFFVYYILIQ